MNVLAYLNKFGLNCAEQSGFRRNHSCHTALSKLTSSLLREIDNGNITGLVYMDFKKALDLVVHDILMRKLECYNFVEFSLRWFKSYLTQRTQVVQLGSNFSQPRYIKTGVRQGFVLGPLLFILFVNDLPSLISSDSIIFADDFTFKESGKSKQEIERKCQVSICETAFGVLRTKW